jgi:HAD superfamily hydrolase (TIGR01549 family)
MNHAYEQLRISPEELAEQLLGYDVISFDVFGTLILRPFASPRALFSIMEQRLGFYKYSGIRVDSENEIREERLRSDNHDNVSLDDIHSLIARKTGLDARKTAELEYELERAYCYASPFFQKVMTLCQKARREIVISSDMYLSREQIAGILEKEGYRNLNRILVSSEMGKSKQKGDLFQYLRESCKGLSIVHVGDDPKADAENARKAGIAAVLCHNANDIGGRNRIPGMSYMAGRVYSALVNQRLYCNSGERDEPLAHDEFFRFGYLYGGMYVLGFAQWINQFARNAGLDKVLFLSRDGDLVSKIYDMLPGHGPREYFYWSRLAGMKITARDSFDEFCQRMIRHKARGVYRIELGHFLKYLDLDALVPHLGEYRLAAQDLLSAQTAPVMEKMFYEHKELIISSYMPDIEATIQAVDQAVGNASGIAVADVGWAGTGPLIIKRIIRHVLKRDCRVYALLAGYRQPISSIADLTIMDGSVHAYLFSQSHNRDLLELHQNLGFPNANLMLELFTQSCSPSFLGYTAKGLRFDREVKENYPAIRRISAGITAFAADYIGRFRQDPFMLNIPAYDAYLSFSALKNEENAVKRLLDRIVYDSGGLADPEGTSRESLLSFMYRDK